MKLATRSPKQHGALAIIVMSGLTMNSKKNFPPRMYMVVYALAMSGSAFNNTISSSLTPYSPFRKCQADDIPQPTTRDAPTAVKFPTHPLQV